jgi:translocation and assembly module TamA
MQVSGVERYDPVLVPRLARLKAGDVYDQNQLVEAQFRLASSGYFDSASIFVDPESDPLAAPVQVQVREAKLQKIILGVGLTTDSGPRASVEHTHHRVPGTGWRAVTKLQLEKKSPFAQTEWTSIPDEASWRWVALGRTERLDDNELITRAQRLRFGRTQAGARIDRSIYLQYDRARVSGAGLQGNSAADEGDGSALTANYVWTGRYFDSLPFPGRGYGLGFELGGGSTLGENRQPFTRTVGRWLGIQPLERGRLAMRAEGGAVLAKDSASIPGTQLFRTGGDNTVRGYGLRDIGIKRANGATGPGRYLAVASIEWQRPILRGGLPSEFESTLFLDAGAVADKTQDLRPSVGVGAGVRWRSPIGPLQMDLAYGVKVRRLRLHVSVGFVF